MPTPLGLDLCPIWDLLMKRYLKFAIALIIVIIFAGAGITNLKAQDHKIQLKEVQLQDTGTELKKLQLDYDILNKEIDQERHRKNIDKEKIKNLEKERDKLQNKTIELEKQVNAKREAQRLAAERLKNASNSATFTGYASAGSISGSCSEWKALAGIPNTHATNTLIDKESGCNPRAVNPSSGACGIPQALPCSKMGPVNPDGTSGVGPVGQLRWMDNYVHDRYGSWDAALSAWYSRCGSPEGCWY